MIFGPFVPRLVLVGSICCKLRENESVFIKTMVVLSQDCACHSVRTNHDQFLTPIITFLSFPRLPLSWIPSILVAQKRIGTLLRLSSEEYAEDV